MMKYLSLDTPSGPRLVYQQLFKEKNIKQAFDLVRSGQCASRVSLARAMHLSATTLSALTEELKAAGLILEENPTPTAQPGRRAGHLRLNDEGRQLAVFSLTRRGVAYTLFDLACRKLEELFVRFPVDDPQAVRGDDDYAQLFEDILLHRSQRFDLRRAIVIGVSFPGIYLEDEQAFSVRAAMNVSFSEASMRGLECRLGVPLFLANVSMCRAYAEKKCLDALEGRGHEIQDLLFINVCDGVGAGIISMGSILTGPFNTAGEFGHISVDAQGKPCPCGNRGCLEQYVNLNAILASAQAACMQAGIEAPQSLADLSGMPAHVPQVDRVIMDVADKLAFGIHTLLCATGIRRVVVGGGVEVLGDCFLDALSDRLRACHMLTGHLRMTYARSGSDADSLGIAQYFLDKAYTLT